MSSEDMFHLEKARVEEIKIENSSGIRLFIKREDLIHPIVSGNKYRKLKYNIAEALDKNCETLISFGGAYSNHIAALAAAGKAFRLRTIGIIRGEELKDKWPFNPTLNFAHGCGMEFKFVSREEYRLKASEKYIKSLSSEFSKGYIIPEGGTNALAIKGCEEILEDVNEGFDIICSSVGTGGTLAGLINCSKPSQQVLGFSALKGDFLTHEIAKFAKKDNWKLNTDYHFGGYAKINPELISFINGFKKTHKIQLDPIYTGKMMFGINDLIKQGHFKERSRILAIHTGGLQGIYGINEKLKIKGWPLLCI